MIYKKKLKTKQFLLGENKEVTNYILKLAEENTSCVILPCSLNDMAVSADSLYWEKIYRKISFCVTDGMPLVWFFNLKYKLDCERVYGPDLMRDLLKKSQLIGLKHFFYGSSVETLKDLNQKTKKIYPNLNIVGMVSPPYRKLLVSEEAEYLKEIRMSQADILWIGLSSPKQVELAVKWQMFLPNVTIICVGAAFDFIAGSKIFAPQIIQKLGLEWLFRLITEPKRLYVRYLIMIPRFLIKELFFVFR